MTGGQPLRPSDEGSAGPSQEGNPEPDAESLHPIQRQYGERVIDTLRDLVAFGEMAATDVVSHGKDAYDDSRLIRLAAEAVAHRLGEAVARLTDKDSLAPSELAFTIDHPEIPWRAMKGMRNIVAHDYGGIDYEMLWNALAERVPADIARIRQILGD